MDEAKPDSSAKGSLKDSSAEGSVKESNGVVPIDFSTFALSLGASALAHLGERMSADGVPTPVSLPLARQTIDLIALLEEKTAGNLSGEEERLMSQLLVELRMKYTAKCKETPGSNCE